LFCPGLFFSFLIFFIHTAGLLGRVISPSQGRYLHTGQHKHRINAHRHTHASSGIRTHDPRVRASEDSSYLIPRGHRDRRYIYWEVFVFITKVYDLTGRRTMTNAFQMLIYSLFIILSFYSVKPRLLNYLRININRTHTKQSEESIFSVFAYTREKVHSW
jgi:hypothetical protein